MEAAYRFFDNDKVTFDNVLQPHVAQSRRRINGQPEVVLVQDTTEVDLTRPERAVAGAGELDGSRRGFLLHEMQAFTPDGTPLGTVFAEIFNRTDGVSRASAAEERRTNKQRPIEQKESLRWPTGLRHAGRLAREMPAVRVVCVADGEGDVYELFAEPRGTPAVDWLIRACAVATGSGAAAGFGERGLGPRDGPAGRRGPGRVAAADDAADRHARRRSAGRGAVPCALEHRTRLQALEEPGRARH